MHVEQRLEAVAELAGGAALPPAFEKLATLLGHAAEGRACRPPPDLPRSLASLHYGRLQPASFSTLLAHLQAFAVALSVDPSESGPVLGSVWQPTHNHSHTFESGFASLLVHN